MGKKKKPLVFAVFIFSPSTYSTSTCSGPMTKLMRNFLINVRLFVVVGIRPSIGVLGVDFPDFVPFFDIRKWFELSDGLLNHLGSILFIFFFSNFFGPKC